MDRDAGDPVPGHAATSELTGSPAGGMLLRANPHTELAMYRPTPLPTLALALALTGTLLACGDKSDDTGASTEADADTDSDTDADTDTDTDTDTDADADLAAGCLDTPCSLPAVDTAAQDLCEATTGSAADTSYYWGENRYLSGQGDSAVAYRCTSTALTEADCPDMCAKAGLDNPYYNSASKDCSCLGSLPAEGDLAEQLIDLICSSRSADVNVGTFVRAGETQTIIAATVTCRDGNGSDAAACDSMLDLVNTELGTDFNDATDFGSGCSLAKY